MTNSEAKNVIEAKEAIKYAKHHVPISVEKGLDIALSIMQDYERLQAELSRVMKGDVCPVERYVKCVKVKELEAELSRADNEVKDLNDRLDKAYEDMELKDKRIAKLGERLTDAQSGINYWMKTKDELEAELAKVKGECEELKENNKIYNAEYKILMEKYARLQSIVSSLHQIVIEDVPHQYQKRLFEILEPKCSYCCGSGIVSLFEQGATEYKCSKCNGTGTQKEG